MGHSLGQLKDRYITSDVGGDRFAGRTVAGLPITEEAFACLPAHFSDAGIRELTAEYWAGIVPGYDVYPFSFKTVFPYLLAAVIKNESWLRENLHRDHIIFKSPVFVSNSKLEFLRENVLGGISRSAKMVATGVPPHVSLLARMREDRDAQERHVEIMQSR